MKNKGKRTFALFLALALCFGLLQTFAFAEEGEGIFSAFTELRNAETSEAETLEAEASEAGNEVHQHDFDEFVKEYKEQTCNAPGLEIIYQVCACGERVMLRQTPVYGSAVEHQWQWVHYATDSKAPTCVDGYDFYYESCKVCGTKSGATRIEAAPAINKHTYVDGICTVCDKKEFDTDAGSCEHNWLDWIDLPDGPVTEPTCGADGLKTQWRGCLLCDAEQTQEVPDPDRPATGEHEYGDGHACKVCGSMDPASVKPDPETCAHEWGNWRNQATGLPTAPTCVEPGTYIEMRQCTNPECHATQTRTVPDSSRPATGHNYVNGVCTVCGEKDENAPLPEPRFLVTCDDSLQTVKLGDTATWYVTLANNGDKPIQARMSSSVPVGVNFNQGNIIPSREYLKVEPGTADMLIVTYTVPKDTDSTVDGITLSFVDDENNISDSIVLRYIVDGVAGTDPVDPGTDETEPTPTPTLTPAPAAPAPAEAAPAPAAFTAAVTAPAPEEDLEDPETPTADPEEEDEEVIDEPETPMAAPEEDLEDPATPMAAPEEDLDDGATPLAAPVRPAWAVLNLVLTLCTILAGALLLLDPTGREFKSRSGILRLGSLVPALVAFVAFILTENVRLPITLVDRWTLLMVLIALVQLAVCVVAKKAQNSESDGSAAARA